MLRQELAMARDLADELAEREAELGQMPGGDQGSSRRPRVKRRPERARTAKASRAAEERATVAAVAGET